MKEMLEKETIIYLKDFTFPRKENRTPERWEKQTIPKQETMYILTRSMKSSGKPGQINQELQIAEKSNK